jgi:hypothetical protein
MDINCVYVSYVFLQHVFSISKLLNNLVGIDMSLGVAYVSNV